MFEQLWDKRFQKGWTDSGRTEKAVVTWSEDGEERGEVNEMWLSANTAAYEEMNNRKPGWDGLDWAPQTTAKKIWGGSNMLLKSLHLVQATTVQKSLSRMKRNVVLDAFISSPSALALSK